MRGGGRPPRGVRHPDRPGRIAGKALLPRGAPCFNGGMGSHRNTVTGRNDLEPFWPSRQHHDFDRVCCRACSPAQAPLFR
nr:hypothetical protein [Streptomyces caatingaensis]